MIIKRNSISRIYELANRPHIASMYNGNININEHRIMTTYFIYKKGFVVDVVHLIMYFTCAKGALLQ